MPYRPVAIYSLDGTFLGYGVKDDAAVKLQSNNLYLETEQDKLSEQLERLNESQDLTSVWPDSREPEVQRILADETFKPIEMALDTVVDDDNSFYVYEQEPEYDIVTGEPTGKMLDGALNREASVLRYKEIMVPVRPSDVMERTKAACEVVARARAGR